MPNVPAPPTFVAFELLDRTGWGVLVTYEDSSTLNMWGFKSKADADDWIARSSASWLERIKPSH